MEDSETTSTTGANGSQQTAIRFLVESALRKVTSVKTVSKPENRAEWVAYLAEALMSESETPYQSVISSLMAHGVSSEEVYQRYIPDTARYLGELWVSDKASFVDVTMGASRLQALFRDRGRNSGVEWLGRSIPLGHSVLMLIPKYEEHALGAFVAADELRRHGFWVHMGISMDGPEIVELVDANRFSMLGVSLATPKSIERTAELVEFLRKNIDVVPPIVIGGAILQGETDVIERTGADHVAQSVEEAIEFCRLPSVFESLGFDEFC